MNCLVFVPLVFVLTALPTVELTSNATVFETDRLPQNQLMASVGNGYLATVVYSNTVYVSGIFNGRGTKSPSHRARIPSTCDIQVRTNVPGTGRKQSWSLDVAKGVFKYHMTTRNFSLEQTVYAHRVHEHIIVSEISVTNSLDEDIQMAFDTSFNPISRDFDLKMASASKIRQLEFRRNAAVPLVGYSAMSGYIKETEEPDSSRLGVAVVWTEVPRDPVTVPGRSSHKWHFVTAISSSLNTEDFLNDAYNSYVAALRDIDGLLDSHVRAWKDIWDEGRIEMDGNLPLAQAVYGSLYYILSSIRPSWPHGLSPGGLASNDYWGHTFWDQETWMYPPLALLYPDMARSCLQYRMDRLATAKKRAAERSYKGAMYPWESAVTGNEVCPGPIYAIYEQHITGDIGIAVKQYWMATRDRAWFKETGAQLLRAIAEFWASRVTFNQSKDAYVIQGVMRN